MKIDKIVLKFNKIQLQSKHNVTRKEKQEQLIEYDRRIDRLEHLLKNFENTVSTEVEAWHSSPKSVNETSKVTLSFVSNLWSELVWFPRLAIFDDDVPVW